MRLPKPSGAEYCAIGIVLLGASLMAKHYPAVLEHPFVIEPWLWADSLIVKPVDFFCGWLGSLAVVVGIGRILFLEGYV